MAGYHVVDMTGFASGRLTVLERAEAPSGKQGAWWLCQCDCGETTVAFGGSLRDGSKKSCGCLQRELVGYSEAHGEAPEDMAGQRFGRLVVIRRYWDREKRRMVAECRCDCGNSAIAQVQDLRYGKVGSCGCRKAEVFEAKKFRKKM